MMTILTLSKAGYGSYNELKELDSDEFLDIVEHYQISMCIERHEVESNKPKGRR